MDGVLLGVLVIFIPVHVLLIWIPISNSLQALISIKSKILWCSSLILFPFIGVGIFHFKFRSSLFLGKRYKISAAEERARSGTLSGGDD